MANATKTAQRYELAVDVGAVTTFRLRVFESEDDMLGYFLTSRGKKSSLNPLVQQALIALSEEWPQATVEFTVDDDRQITSISSS
jgi:hypothetical protein